MSESILRGHPASSGVALGPAWSYAAPEPVASGTPDDERARVESGLRLATEELAALAATLRAEGHQADADIVDTNRLMAGDRGLIDAALEAAANGLAAAAAIAQAAEPHVQALAGLDDPTLAARAADLRSIARRAGELASGATAEPPPGSIVLAEDLGPADVAGWARLVAGIALAGSGATAHAAIVARSLAIPLVTGIGRELLAVPDGEQ